MSTEVRIAIAGVGNCAAALLQGIEYYRVAGTCNEGPSGLIETKIGEYGVDSICVVAAFDVAKGKVGHDISEALNSPLICTRNASPVPTTGVVVQPSPVLDGIGQTASDYVEIDDEARRAPEDLDRIVKVIQQSKADVLINYLPVGSRRGSEFYAKCALKAGCAFINAIPVSIGREAHWRDAFAAANLPLIGDDVKSQVGATIVHRALVELFSSRGYSLDQTYQLNVGGNLDFANMMTRDRLTDKKISKAQAITDIANRGHGLRADSYHISPSDHIPFLGDKKIAFIRLVGRGFAGAPIELDLKMVVEDSPNSAGVIVDAVRYAKVAMTLGYGGYLGPVSAWLMKAPAYPQNDADALSATRAWLAQLLEKQPTPRD
jgi:myo-inositol-1-phosphate synthase